MRRMKNEIILREDLYKLYKILRRKAFFNDSLSYLADKVDRKKLKSFDNLCIHETNFLSMRAINSANQSIAADNAWIISQALAKKTTPQKYFNDLLFRLCKTK